MNLTTLDWAIIAVYAILVVAIGLLFVKRGGASIEQYFLSGRSVPWWLAGLSMVATTFATDTPLLVTGLVASHGVAGNWLWWSMLMSGMLTVFFFARLWRRARVMTDVEFAEIRYGGAPAAVLRGFRAVYLAIPINLIIMGWVTHAMIRVLQIALGVTPLVAVGICATLVLLYAAASGLWAVLWNDALQFVLMMAAVIILAIFAVEAVGGITALRAGLAEHFGSDAAALSVLPVSVGPGGISGYAWMPLLTLVVFLSVQWWAAWYPGAEPGGGGYIAQRIFSARTEREGMFAVLFFQFAHYAIRPWPWIVTGLCTVLLYPALENREDGYVHAFVDLLPPGLRGLMLVAFAAAYMSTVSTHLNWGASYLVGDIYKRFLRPVATEAHYVAVSRAMTVLLFAASILVTWQIGTIEGAMRFLLALGSGTGLVLILRWYWWRINAWSEISAMIASLVFSLLATWLVPRYMAPGPNVTSVVMLITVALSTVVWVAVTFATRPERDATLQSFYRRVRPGGPGWATVSRELGYGREPIPGGALAWTNWIAGVVGVYAALFAIGKIIFGDLLPGLIMLAVAGVAFAWIARSLGREAPPPAIGEAVSERGSTPAAA